jgi:hypothetical protein
LLYGLGDRFQNEGMGGFASTLCGSGDAGLEVVFNSDGGGGHAAVSLST